MSKISQDKINYINNHLDVPNKELADFLKIDRGTVRKYKKLQGVVYQPKTYHEYDEYIISHYNDRTSTELAKEIGCSRAYISKVWSEANLNGKSTCRYHFNENFFSTINNGDKAYLLGLIASDGCIYKREGHQSLFQISLQKTDDQLLKDIIVALESNHPIKICNNMATISFVSDIACADLFKIGLHPQKTWSINIKQILSNIPFEYHKDFYRGYFDGDGSISKDINKNPSQIKVKIVGPEQSCLSFQENLKEHKINTTYEKDCRQNHYSQNFGCISFTNMTSKYCFLRWIYSNANLKLNRKNLLSKNFLQKIENNETNRAENIDAVKTYELMFNGKNNI